MNLVAGLLPFGFLIAVALLRHLQGHGLARSVVEAYLIWAIASFVSAEFLSAFNAINVHLVLAFWVSVFASVLYLLWRTPATWTFRLGLRPDWTVAVVVSFVSVLLFISLTVDPNNFDSQTYRLPRIEHWIQNGSLAHYPTPDERQNAHGPLAEILLLHLRTLGGNDSLYGLMQWASMVCCIAAAHRIAGQLGGGSVHRWVAAVFVATLPIGVLQSTSTQNDYVSAALLAAMVTFGLELLEPRRPMLLPLMEAVASGALAGIVKPSAYLIGLGFALWFGVRVLWKSTFNLAAIHGLCAGLVLLLFTGPFFARNLATYGTIGDDKSASVLNASHGIPQTVDNLILNVALNFVIGVDRIDNLVRAGALKVASILHVDRNRTDTVLSYNEVQNPNSAGALLDDYGPNPLHITLVILAYALLLRAPRHLIAYAAAALAGFVLFCFALRWQSWGVRLQLPIFVLMAPLVGMLLPDSNWQSWRTRGVVALMTLAGLPALLFNQGRPLLPFGSRPSYLAMSTEQRYPNFYGREFVAFTRDLMCRTEVTRIGLMSAFNVAEYPIWQALRSAPTGRSFRVEHIGVSNGMRYPLGPFEPEVIMSVLASTPEIVVGGRAFERIFPAETSTPPRIAIYLAKGMPLPANLSGSPLAAASSACR